MREEIEIAIALFYGQKWLEFGYVLHCVHYFDTLSTFYEDDTNEVLMVQIIRDLPMT